MKIAIVSPVLAMRAGLRAMLSDSAALEKAVEQVQVVYEAASLEDEEIDLPISQIDVLILTADAQDPALKRLLAEADNPPGVVLLAEKGGLVQELIDMEARAWGLLPPDASAEELLAAAQAVHQGLLVGAPALIEPSLTQLLSGGAEGAAPLVEELTERESQVLQLLASGLANKQIALELEISEHTVKFHVSSIYTKLSVTNRAQAVRSGIQQGLISL